MGMSTFILFNTGKSIKIDNLLLSIDRLCKAEKLFYSGSLQEHMDDKLKYSEICVSDISLEQDYNRQIRFGIADEPYKYRNIDFNWDLNNQSYFKTLISEDFYENEDLLLKFLLGFLTIYPEAKIWIEEEWFYTLDDLKRIKQRPFDNNWCYKNPLDL